MKLCRDSSVPVFTVVTMMKIHYTAPQPRRLESLHTHQASN